MIPTSWLLLGVLCRLVFALGIPKLVKNMLQSACTVLHSLAFFECELKGTNFTLCLVFQIQPQTIYFVCISGTNYGVWGWVYLFIFWIFRKKDKETTSEALGIRLSGMQVQFLLLLILFSVILIWVTYNLQSVTIRALHNGGLSSLVLHPCWHYKKKVFNGNTSLFQMLLILPISTISGQKCSELFYCHSFAMSHVLLPHEISRPKTKKAPMSHQDCTIALPPLW
jgi:hypothetical protein